MRRARICGLTMLFNSTIFLLLFLPVTAALFFGARTPDGSKLALILMSMIFYAWWSALFLLLILAGIVINYFISRYLLLSANERGRRFWLVAGIVINLVPLLYFKYMAFFVETLNAIGDFDFVWQRVVLPLAISFYTFQKIVLLVQSYRREVPDVAFRSYALFILFFPHLIAGPITSARELLPQFDDPKTYRFRFDDFALGLSIFACGLAKKVLIADAFAPNATAVFAAAERGDPLSMVAAWVGALSFTLQLYFDFSGYSDMAVGLARMFNIRMPINFFSPYKATSIVDFWRRWHMSLSWFLREYVYFPLGGSRRGMPRHLTNLLVTMLISGLWHGAGWTFIAFGAVHGVALMIQTAWHNSIGIRINAVAGWAATMLVVIVGWVFFRAETMSGALAVLGAMFSGGRAGTGPVFGPDLVTVIAAALIATVVLPNTTEIFEPQRVSGLHLQPGSLQFSWGTTRGWASATAVLLAACLTKLGTYSEFLYFNF
jgi:D-alanyl-lipoteichoic acid acyltransferase DltB (MBOAT superfamily)